MSQTEQDNPAAPPVATALAAFRVMSGTSAAEVLRTTPKPAETDLAGWTAALVEAGVSVHRVASPDLIGQLHRAESAMIDTIICSVLDTDPSVPLNAAVASAFTAEIAAGIALLASLTNAKRLWITADPDKSSDWFSTVEYTVKRPGLRLVPLRADYPQTDPTLMLLTLLQRRLPPRHLPTEKGTILLDAIAAAAIGRCVLQQPPLRITPLAVRDHFARKTHLLLAPVGVRLGDVCEFLGIHHFGTVFRGGDFLRDQWLTPDSPLGGGELIIHATAKHLDANPDPCIHCGWCLEACPARINPAGLLDAAQQRSGKLAKRFGLEACIECGICSYVCPTRLPLLASIKRLGADERGR